MSTKVHLTQSEDPLTQGEKILALCSAVIPNAVFAFSLDPGEEAPEMVSTIYFCQKCMRELLSLRGRNPLHYLYGVRSGEEVKQEEAAA